MSISVLIPFVHLDELGVQEKMGPEDGPRKGATKQTKQIKKTTGPIEDTTKTRALAEFGGYESDSNDSNAELSSGNDDTSHAEAPSDSTYYKGDE
jgi:hypothetical protein